MPKVNGMYSGVRPVVYPLSNPGRIDELMEDIVKAGNESSVVNLVMVPTTLFSNSLDENPKATFTEIIIPGNLDGYIPRNKKLLAFPYVVFQVDGMSSRRNFRYEWLRQAPDQVSFKLWVDGCASPNPQVIVYPEYYNGISYAACNGVIVDDFPQCAFPIDSYNAWLAMKSTQYKIDMAQGAVGTLGNVLTGNLVGAAMGVLGMMTTMNQNVLAATTGDKIQGEQAGNILVAINRKTIYYNHLSVKKEVARSIDDFFDRYGYAVERLKVPNRNVRPHWCYTMTKNCAVKGEIPGYYARQIEEVYNKGITFWKVISEVGDYSLDNTV